MSDFAFKSLFSNRPQASSGRKTSSTRFAAGLLPVLALCAAVSANAQSFDLLSEPAGVRSSIAKAVSYDGSVTVGAAYGGSPTYQALYWTGLNMSFLTGPGTGSTDAYFVSDNGKVIGGGQQGYQNVIWDLNAFQGASQPVPVGGGSGIQCMDRQSTNNMNTSLVLTSIPYNEQVFTVSPFDVYTYLENSLFGTPRNTDSSLRVNAMTSQGQFLSTYSPQHALIVSGTQNIISTDTGFQQYGENFTWDCIGDHSAAAAPNLTMITANTSNSNRGLQGIGRIYPNGSRLLTFSLGNIQGMSYDGQTIVGAYGPGAPQTAGIWTDAFGFYDLKRYASDVLGLQNALAGWQVLVGTAISGDGTTIVGTAYDTAGLSSLNGHAFRLYDPNRFRISPAAPVLVYTVSKEPAGGPRVVLKIANTGAGDMHDFYFASATLNGVPAGAYSNPTDPGYANRFLSTLNAGASSSWYMAFSTLPAAGSIATLRVTLYHSRGAVTLTRRFQY